MVTTLAANDDDFVSRIHDAVHKGYSFVPFVGAGFSVSAGIPITPDINRYLNYCILSAFGLLPAGRLPLWRPRRQPWPSFESWVPPEIPTAHRLDEIFRGALATANLPAAARLREAYGASVNWRSALTFLSRIHSSDRLDQAQPANLHLGQCDASVIDSFFHHLIAGRDPALTHRMLHALSVVLRCDVLLTTNFDNLIERAFEDAGSSLEEWPISSHDPLPDAVLVLKQRSLLKLHGARFSLKADDSLDEPPTAEDIGNFLGCLAGRPIHRQDTQTLLPAYQRSDEPVALFICGVSCSERRIADLLLHSLVWLPKLQIFWLGYNESDMRNAMDLGQRLTRFHEAWPDLDINCNDRICGHVSRFPGLLLLHMFQDLTRTIPSSGAIFPSLWHLSMPAIHPFSKDTAPPAIDLRNRISKGLKAYHGGDQLWGRSLSPLYFTLKGVRAGEASLIVSRLFYEDWNDSEIPPEPVRTLWLELDEIAEPAGFFLRLVLLIAKSLGADDPISTLSVEAFYRDDLKKEFMNAVAKRLRRAICEAGALWVIFVDVEQTPGCNSLFSRAQSPWTDNAVTTSERVVVSERITDRWTNTEYLLAFADGICKLTLDHKLPIQLVFFTGDLSAQQTAARPGAVQLQKLLAQRFSPQVLDCKPVLETADDRVTAALEALRALSQGNSSLANLTRFMHVILLHLLTVFRVPIYPAALREIVVRLATRARLALAQAENAECPIDKLLKQVVDTLATYAIIRRKPGGFLWVHPTDRDVLARQVTVIEGDLKDGILAELKLRLRWYVARWYGRLLLSSQDPMAAIQTIDNEIAGVSCALTDIPESLKVPSGVARLPTEMIRHAKHVLGISEELIRRRLSDQYADRAVGDLFVASQQLRNKCPLESRWRGLTDELNGLVIQLARMRTTLLRRSGHFLTAIRFYESARDSIDKLSKIDDLPPDARVDLHALRIDVANSWLCLRCYDRAEQELHKVLWDIIEVGEDDKPTAIVKNPKAVADSIRNWALDKHTDTLITAVRVIERLMYLEMHRSQGRYCASAMAYGGTSQLAAACNSSGEDLKADDRMAEARTLRATELNGARKWGRLGLSLLRLCSTRDRSRVFVENVRIRAHDALCMALIEGPCQAAGSLPESDFSPESDLARIKLIEAQGYIDGFFLKEAGVLRAMCELRAAELAIVRVGVDKEFRSWRRRIFDMHLEVCLQQKRSELDSRQWRADDEKLQSHITEAYDALRSIGRAEVELRRHRKSRWWWWLLLVLKTKACEYLYICRYGMALQERAGSRPIGQSNKLLPRYVREFLRQELIEGVAETMMDDVFLLARIVQSFERTCHADYAFASIVATGEKEPRVKLTRARRTLEDLIDLLSTAMDRLDEGFRKDAGLYEGDTIPVHPAVLQYAASVKVSAERAVRGCPIWS